MSQLRMQIGAGITFYSFIGACLTHIFVEVGTQKTKELMYHSNLWCDYIQTQSIYANVSI